VSPADRRVIALGNLVGELKSSLEEATRSSGIELVLTREPAKALVELERASAVAVLVDMATLGAEQFCKRARGTERLRGVPIIGMSRTPSELGFARVFAWGADDLVPLGATPALARRLSALSAAAPTEQTSFGQAVVAEGTTQRRALLGRVLVHAGYDVKFAVDRGSVELYASQAETRIVVISATLGDPRKLIESASKAGGLATWIVTAEARSVARLASGLAGLERVVVTSTAGSPEDILFLANEIVFGKGNRPREWRALYGTPVAFRPLGATTDDYGFTYDVSPGGLYVRSLLPCESDDVEVELRPPERDERVRLLGKVVRRFAFGSGSVASAPPGFGVKVTGPSSPALTLWIEACRAHVEQAGSGSPPDARTPTGAPEKKASESSMPALAVPGPNLTIESVVLPLPSERTDVAGLLSETLGEEAPPEAGTRPVTVDAETGGVREERPSEYGMSLEGTEASLTPPPDVSPAEPHVNRPPSRPPLPIPVAPQREEHDDTTTVYERSEVEAFAQRRDREAARLLTPFPQADPDAITIPPLDAITVPPVSMSEAVTAPPKASPIADEAPPFVMPAAAPPPVIAEAPEATTAPEAPEAPPLAPPVAPVTTPAAFAGTIALPPRPQATGLGGTIVMSPPVPPRVLEPPAKSSPIAASPPAPPVVAPPPPSARHVPSPPAPVVAPPARVSTPEPTPLAPVAVAEPPAPQPFSAYDSPSVQATSRGFPMQAPPPVELQPPPPAESLPRPTRPAEVHPEVPVPSEPLGKKKSGGSGLLLGVIALVALAAGVGGGVLFLTRSNTTEKPAEPAPPPQVVEPAPANVEPAAPSPSAETPSPARPSAAPPAASVAEPPPEPSGNPTPAPAETAAPSPPVAVAPPSFDLEKLPGDRAALLVRSTATARVFVHGKDYGETNQYLLTSCGIRFVRLGRGFNEFIEPGRSVVVKCGRLTELSIEPDR
jgi:hypothetical protein